MPMQLYDVSGLGGYLAVPELTRKVRYKALSVLKFGQFVRSEPGFGPKRSGSFYFDKVASDLGVTPTHLSDRLVEDNPIPEDTVSIEQGSQTVYEYGRAVAYSGKLTALGQIAIEPIVEQVLRNRLAKVLDAVHAYAFKQGDMIYIPTGVASGVWDTDGVASTPATANGNAFHVMEVVDYMRDTLRIPPYFAQDDTYACIASGKFIGGIYRDPNFEMVQVYAEPQARLRGEVGRYYHTRFVWTNHAGALSNAVGTNGVLGEALFFGEDPVVHGVVVPPEIRAKTSERDFGRSMGLAWYGLFGTGPTWEYAVDSETRIVWVTSQ